MMISDYRTLTRIQSRKSRIQFFGQMVGKLSTFLAVFSRCLLSSNFNEIGACPFPLY